MRRKWGKQLSADGSAPSLPALSFRYRMSSIPVFGRCFLLWSIEMETTLIADSRQAPQEFQDQALTEHG
ncbi:MAG: hypothetical protein QOJ59_1498 [Thermomicrobiales bacterium]|jgi:hypothetical protein|nr:hypothetical protein [Thermomicrobiales bacterium]